MRKHMFLAALLAAGAMGLATMTFTDAALARPGGCLKGAVVGGVAGHLAHHSMVGAAAGCAYGVHKRHEYDRGMTGRSAATAPQHN